MTIPCIVFLLKQGMCEKETKKQKQKSSQIEIATAEVYALDIKQYKVLLKPNRFDERSFGKVWSTGDC